MVLDRLGTLAAVVLALVFAAAAVAKLIDPIGTARTFRALRLPVPGRLARLVPAAELLLALTLVVRPWIGGLAALATLAAFTTLLVAEIRQGTGTGCGCFGRASTAPVSFVELIRNGLLAVTAVVAVFAERPTAPDLPSLVAAVGGVAAGMAVLRLARVRHDAGPTPDRTRPASPLRTWLNIVSRVIVNRTHGRRR